MALSTESANLVRQKTRMYTLNPAVFYSLKAFFLYHATHNGNADLQFVPFDATSATAADGQDHGIDAAHQVYFVYCKKAATGVDTWFRAIDDAETTQKSLVMCE